MSVHKSSLSQIEQLERQLANCLPTEKSSVRRAKNGDIIYQTVRPAWPLSESSGSGVDCANNSPSEKPQPQSTPDPFDPAIPDVVHALSSPAPNDSPNNLPNTLPQTPMNQEIGNLNADFQDISTTPVTASAAPETTATVALVADGAVAPDAQQPPPDTALTCHDTENPDNQPADPLTDLLQRALTATKKRRGQPPAFDDHARGQLVALLSVGMSMRQAASVLGVSHTTVQNTLKADPALAEQITAARFQAQLQPLACVIREARRSWKAATWLLKYLDTKIASHEETPDEARQRQQRETDEFFARAHSRNAKTRRVRD